MEFQGPLVQNVAYFNGSSTVNITYTAVSSIELRNPNGFEVCHFFSSIRIILCLVPRFVVIPVNVEITSHGFHQLYQVKMD